ncbi:unnamed protein product [Choristocarpus tenellus]
MSAQTSHLPKDTLLGCMYPVDVVNTTHSHINTISSTFLPLPDQTRLDNALKPALFNTTFSSSQTHKTLNLCPKFRSVISLDASESGTCTIAEADFPLKPGARPISQAPYRTNPHVTGIIDKCIEDLQNQGGLVEARSSPLGSPVAIVAKADETPTFCIDYRRTHIALLEKLFVALQKC